jgi:hypothetical protein
VSTVYSVRLYTISHRSDQLPPEGTGNANKNSSLQNKVSAPPPTLLSAPSPRRRVPWLPGLGPGGLQRKIKKEYKRESSQRPESGSAGW